MTRKTSSPSGLSLGGLSGGSSGGSSGCPAASGGNKGHNHLTVVHGGSGPTAGGGPVNARGQPTSYSTASTASDHSDPLSWAPLLGNRSGPESSLWWKIAHFHAPILLKISSTEKSIELCSTKSWRLFFWDWRSEQRNIFVKLKLFGYFFGRYMAIWSNILNNIHGSTDSRIATDHICIRRTYIGPLTS